MNAEIELARTNTERALREGLEAESQLIKDYLDGYEFRGDEASHTPNNNERAPLDDAIAGLAGDEEFRALVVQNESRRKLLQSLPASPPASEG